MKVIDLSKTIHSEMEVFPGDPGVKISLVHTYEKDTWQFRNISMGLHTGTLTQTSKKIIREKIIIKTRYLYITHYKYKFEVL